MVRENSTIKISKLVIGDDAECRVVYEFEAVCGSVAHSHPSLAPHAHLNSNNNPISHANSNTITINVIYYHTTVVNYDNRANIIYITDYQVLANNSSYYTNTIADTIYTDYQVLNCFNLIYMFIVIFILLVLIYMMRLSIEYIMSNL